MIDVRQRAHARGLTLVEVMVVLVLMALLTTSLVFGSGALFGAERRAAASLIIVAVRKGLAEANGLGKPVRLSIDMSTGRLLLEVSQSRQALRTPTKPTDQAQEDPAAESAEIAEAVQTAQSAGESLLKVPVDSASGFSPLDVLGQDGAIPGRQIDASIKITKVQTEHDPEPLTEGKAFIYFWPGGMTERAIVQLGRGLDDDGLTVEVSPLTGRARIVSGKQELPQPLSTDEDYSERDER